MRSPLFVSAGTWIAAMMLCTSSVCAQDGEHRPSPPIGPNTAPVPTIITATATLRGTVSSSDGRPIRSAEVRLRSMDGHDSRIVTTDAAGQYLIRDLTPGLWNLWVSKPGFVTEAITAADRKNGLTITNGQKLSRDVVLGTAGAIAGRVIDDAGEPLADVQVQAFKRRSSSEPSLTAVGVADTTDDTGAFRLYAIPPGTYFVRAVTDAGNRAPGFVNNANGIYYPGTSDPQNAEPVTVAAGQEQLGLTLAIPPLVSGVSVTGTILTAAGAPAGDDTSIHLIRPTGSGQRRDIGRLAQVSNGQFRIAGVPPGDYEIDALGSLARPDSWERAQVPITVGTYAINGVAIAMTPTRTVKGTVVLDPAATAQRTFPGLSVVLETPSSALGTNSTAVPALGDFSLLGIWGLHGVGVSGLPPTWMVKRIEIAGQEIGAGLFDFTSVPASATLRITITDRIGELAGTVSAGSEGRRATVVVFPDDETRWRSPTRYVLIAGSDDDGVYRIRGLGEMSYRAVAVSTLDPDELVDPAFLTQMKRSAVSFSLREGEKKTLNLSLIQR
jgi:hypothetical protein